MMENYSSETILYESSNCTIKRVVKKSDRKKYILKTQTETSLDIHHKLEYEYNLLKEVDSPYIIKAYGFEREGNEISLILEDIEAISLHTLLEERKLKVSAFLDYALLIAEGVKALHAQNIIHKDINPSNIIINEKTGDLKIIDLSISQKINTNELVESNIIEGTTEYISPEQTGHLQTLLDFRTDLYSLGITFYEMITGVLPFEFKETSELIFAHLAKQAVSPHERNSKIPEMLSQIIMKLIAKNPAERYQTIIGLKKDLEKCRFVITDNNDIPQFSLGEDDFNFSIEDEFINYLSTDDFSEILQNCNEVLEGKCVFTKLSSFTERTNPNLIKTILDLAAEKNFLILQADFQTFKTDAFTNLIKSLFEQIFSFIIYKSGNQDKWFKLINDKLGENITIICDIYPPAEKVLGVKPELKTVSVMESKRRYFNTLKDFISLIPKRELPVVYLLRNLHLADTDSIEFVNECLVNNDLQYFWLFSDYYLHSGQKSVLILDFLEQKQNFGTEVKSLQLQDIDPESITTIIANKFLWSYDTSSEIALVMYYKTMGNPYFLNLLLKRCFAEQIIRLDYEIEAWICDVGKLQELELAKNVVETIIENISNLSPEAKRTLLLASSIDSVFNFRLLQKIGNFEENELRKNLQTLVTNEFLKYHSVYENESMYEFTHDKLHQACYELLDEEAKDYCHAQLAKHYLRLYQEIHNTSKNPHSPLIYQIVSHLNSLINKSILENYYLISFQYNIIAGKMSKETTSYGKAYDYYKKAISPFLTNPAGEKLPEDFFSGVIATADLALTNNDLDFLDYLIDTSLNNNQTTYERLRLLEFRMRSQITKNELSKSLETGLICLKILGISFPQNPNRLNTLIEFTKTKNCLKKVDFLGSETIPGSTDKDKILLINILLLLRSSAYAVKPNLLSIIVFKAIREIVRECPPEGVYFFAGYAMYLCGVLNNIPEGYKIGSWTLRLLDKFPQSIDKARTTFVLYAFVIPWKQPLFVSLSPLMEVYSDTMTRGDYEYSSNAAAIYTYFAFISGEKLDSLTSKIGGYNLQMQQNNQNQLYVRNAIWYQAILNFYQLNNDPLNLSGPHFTEEETLKDIRQNSNKTTLFDFCLIKMMLGVYFYDFESALPYSLEAYETIESRKGSIVKVYFYVYESLLLLNILREKTQLSRTQRLRKVKRNQTKLKKWADLNPDNFLNKYYLVEAEKYRFLKDYQASEEFYIKSINAAAQYSFIQEEALAKEMLAKLYIEKGISKIAIILLEEAISDYQEWKAENKVKQLYAHFLPILGKTKSFLSTFHKGSTSRQDREFFEIDAVVRTYKAISGEVKIDNLLKKLISIILHNSGANKGILLIKEGDQVMVKVDANADEEEPRILEGIRYQDYKQLPKTFVTRMIKEEVSVIIDNIISDGLYYEDAYFQTNPVKSLLCIPIQNKSIVQGFLYLENQHVNGAFSRSRLPLLELIASQFAASLETAGLYKSIKQSEEKYRTLVDNLQDGVFIVQDNVIQYVNKGFLEIIGLRYEDVVGVVYSDFISEDFWVLLEHNFSLIMAGALIPKEMEITFLHHEGKTVPVIMSAGFISYNDKDAIECTIKDITERKLSENNQKMYNETLKQQIAEKTKDIRNLLDHAGQGFLTFGENLIVDQEYSKECDKIFHGDISKRDFVELLFIHQTEEEKNIHREILGKLFLATNKLSINAYFSILPEETPYRKRFLKLEFKLINVDSQKKMMVIITDITEKKILEHEMEHERNIQKMIVKAISDSSLIKKSIHEYKHYFQEELKTIIYSDIAYSLKISAIYRKIHTFKGDFGQWNMIHVTEMLMQVENTLTSITNQKEQYTQTELSDILCQYDYTAWIQSETDLIKDKIGRDIFDESDTLIVDKKVIYEIEDFIFLNFPKDDYRELIQKVRKLRYVNLKDLLLGYSDYLFQLAERLGKVLKPLEVEGANIFLDYDIYYDFSKVIGHIFRNMIDHGIELPDIRLASLNKPEAGTIKCILRKGPEQSFILTLTDDGSGIDFKKIRTKIADKFMDNTLDENFLLRINRQYQTFDADLLGENDLIEFLFCTGFSTKETATSISGRGVGLGAVKQEIERLDGTLTILSEQNKGTTFTIKMPIREKSFPKDIDLNIITQAVENQLLAFFAKSIQIDLCKEAITISDNYCLNSSMFSSFIDIRGMFRTRVVISLQENIAITTLDKFLVELPTQQEKVLLLHPTIAEILNIILGNSLAELEEQNIHLKISTPVILNDAATQVCLIGQKCHQLLYTSPLGNLQLIFIYDEKL